MPWVWPAEACPFVMSILCQEYVIICATYCVSLTFFAGIKAKWIGDSQRAVERGEALARAELERQLDIERQVEAPTESKQELASTKEKTV